MIKKFLNILFWILIIAGALAGISALSRWFLNHNQEKAIYVALAGPLGEDLKGGDDIQRGVELGIAEANAAGGIDGRPIKLLKFNDDNDSDLAKKVAQRIVDSPAVAVIGHYYSGPSIAAGELYEKAGIAAVSGSATADEVTRDRRWYFRVIPDNHSQGVFLANYAWSVRNDKSAIIIYEDGGYGRSLESSFRNSFRGLGGTIQREWMYDYSVDPKTQVQQIVGQMIQDRLNPPDVVFVAMYADDAGPLIVAMRRAGLNYAILGGDTIGDPTTPDVFADQPEEQARPGYFSDGIYAATPMMFDMAGELAFSLQDKMAKQGFQPGWGEAMYYDATLVLVDAIKHANLQVGPQALAQNRAAVRDALERNNSPATAVQGVTGMLYFDNQHNPSISMIMGTFQQKKFISAPVQLQPATDITRIVDLKKELADGNMLIVNGKYMYRTRLVYAGVDFNEIGDVNLKDSTFLADFYLWFRYQGDFDEMDIEFPNAVEPIHLGDPVLETISGGSTYHVYRIKAKFKSDFDYSDYPFDEQPLKIAFRHRHITRENLIYVPDIVGMKFQSSKETVDKLSRVGVFKAGSSWEIRSIEFYQDVPRYDTTLGNPAFFNSNSNIEYSSFNAVVVIQRDVPRFMVKNMVPLLLIILIAYTAFLFSPDQLSERFSLGTGSLLTTAFFHMSLTSELPQIGYVVAMEYVFYAIYVLYFIIIISAFLTWVLWKQKSYKFSLSINRISAITYEAIILIGLVLLDHTYQIVPRPQMHALDTATAQTAAVLGPEDNQTVTLRMGSWRADDVAGVQQILDEFHAQHPDIVIEFQPSVATMYNSALEAQLEKGTAPDLFYLRSYSTSRDLYNRGFLEPLADLPGLQENFPDSARSAWSTDDGLSYGVPLVGSSHAIYYNETIFDNLGLTKPRTWDELLETARILHDNGIVPFANGTKDRWDAGALIFLNIAPNYTGGYEGRMQYLEGKRCFNDAHIVAAYQAISDLEPYLPDGFLDLGYEDSRQMFANGKAAMWLGGSWDIPFLDANIQSFEWGVMAVPPPAGQPGYVTFHPDAGMGLNAASTHKAEARIFLQWMTTREFASLLGDALPGQFPLLSMTPQLADPHANQFLGLNRGRHTDIRFTWERMMDGMPGAYSLIQDGTIGVLSGQMTPQQAADVLQAGLGSWFEPAQQCK